MNTKRAKIISFTKTCTWRVVASLDTFLLSWLITGNVKMGMGIASLEVLTKMFLYYGHERGWDRIKWGREEFELPTEIFPSEDWKIKRLKNFLNKKHKRLAKLL